MARSIDILEIGPNDDLAEVVRKSNYNFRNTACVQHADDGSILNVQDEIEVVKEDLARQVDKLVELIKDTAQSQDDRLDSIDNRLDNLEAALSKVNPAPPPGTWMFCDADPNTIYPGTTWVRVAQGTFMMASGSTYTNGGKYGSNTHTLTVNEMPRHNHAQRGRDPNAHLAALGDRVAAEFLGYSNNPVGNTFDTGGSQPHNNIPQSIAAPLWHRTA